MRHGARGDAMAVGRGAGAELWVATTAYPLVTDVIVLYAPAYISVLYLTARVSPAQEPLALTPTVLRVALAGCPPVAISRAPPVPWGALLMMTDQIASRAPTVTLHRQRVPSIVNRFPVLRVRAGVYGALGLWRSSALGHGT